MKAKTYLGLPEDWASMLDMRLLLAQADPTRQKVYICSPCRAETTPKIYANMMAARFYMHHAYTEMSMYPIAPHAYLTLILSDNQPQEREMALRYGLELLSCAELVLVCGKRLTDGMRGEILKATELDIPVHVYSIDVFREIKNITNSPLVRYKGETLLSLSANEITEI